ncbi:MAG: zinc-ribbon and DUF3426 domain-containing protein [Gammaproteobacteria bacterium]|nr:zinc-ribbon and DUF3426 domain-containing protein [Gammaproteobacteria bacterium]
MFTVCPKCGLMLVVTAADLRAAQGHVRCGRCRSVFNALESLAEPPAQDGAAADRSAAAAPSPEPEPEPEPAATEAVLSGPSSEFEWIEPEREPQWTPEPTVEAPSQPPAAEAQAPPEPQWEEEEEAEEEDAILPAPQHGDAAVVLQMPQPPIATLDEPLTAEGPHEAAASEPSLAEEPPHEFQLETPQRHTGAWFAGALVLLLVLAGQAVNHYRGILATMPSVGSKLLAVYGALGIPVVPRWNVHAYQARQLGATVSGSDPHQITVRASVANDGPWPLPLPLLRVTLQDRYGRTIAARDVRPSDYLTRGSSGASMLASGERIDATVAFVNPGSQAVGFEIDACLREGSRVVCAHGAH